MQALCTHVDTYVYNFSSYWSSPSGLRTSFSTKIRSWKRKNFVSWRREAWTLFPSHLSAVSRPNPRPRKVPTHGSAIQHPRGVLRAMVQLAQQTPMPCTSSTRDKYSGTVLHGRSSHSIRHCRTKNQGRDLLRGGSVNIFPEAT